MTQATRDQLAAQQKVNDLEKRLAEASQTDGPAAPQGQTVRALAGLLSARKLELTRANQKHEEGGIILTLLTDQVKMTTSDAIAVCDRCRAVISAGMLSDCHTSPRSVALLLCPTCSAMPTRS